MSNVVIKVENISKQYRLGAVGTGSFAHDINRSWYRLRGKEDPYLKIGEINDRTKTGNSDYVWALKDINFDVKQGEVLGIIGRNGAGKSTLLKILSRTTSPTTGSVKIKGRVASLLEVGTGFHPELSGRENIFLNGAILGMTKQEIKRKFDEIVDFAGVERYVDTPVKRYSSGMYVRLAFGVAAHLEPEILIVDEVLAVGDAEFQKKALGKMKDVSTKEGRTVLFVSHNMPAIRQLCGRGILLNHGCIEFEGYAEAVIQQYFKSNYQSDELPEIDSYRSYDNSMAPVTIEGIFIEGFHGVIPKIPMYYFPKIVLRINAKQKIEEAIVAISVINADGINIGIAFSWDDNFYLNIPGAGAYDIFITLKSDQFVPGQYFITAGLNQSEQTITWDGIAFYPLFVVENQNNVKHFVNRAWGINHFSGNQWHLQKVEKDE